MDRRAFLGLVAAASAVAMTSRADDTPPPDPYQALVKRELRRIGHPAMAGGVVLKDRLVGACGTGYRHKYRGGRVDADTVFRVASITKTFAGLALLQLRDAGKLTLDDPLAKHLPEADSFVYPSSDTPPITLRHLVTHTSGIPRNATAGLSEAALLRSLKGVRLDHTPGEHTAYSNLAMGLAGPIVHRVSGQSFREYMQSNVFAPLGMTSCAWEARDVDSKRLAWGNEKKKDGEKEGEIEPVDTEWRMGAAEAFGGLYASVNDMAKMVMLQLSDAQTSGAESSVLKRASLKESHTQATSGQPEAQKYGVNWWLGDEAVWHSGATDEYSASVVMLPSKGVGAIVLSSYADVATIEAMARRIAKKAGDLSAA
jgi:CubicO group peptidase (beta-lactamase class C family)